MAKIKYAKPATVRTRPAASSKGIGLHLLAAQNVQVEHDEAGHGQRDDPELQQHGSSIGCGPSGRHPPIG
jgi:hypothetical protein